MKTRYIVVSVIICLLLLIGYQLFWLFRFHEEQDSEIRQKVQSAIENSDYGEMVIRAKKIDHSLSSYIYLGDDHENKKLIKSEHYIQHKKEYEIETRIYEFQLLFVSLPQKTVVRLVAGPLGQEESLGNTGHSAS